MEKKFEISEQNFTESKVVHYSCNVQNWSFSIKNF